MLNSIPVNGMIFVYISSSPVPQCIYWFAISLKPQIGAGNVNWLITFVSHCLILTLSHCPTVPLSHSPLTLDFFFSPGSHSDCVLCMLSLLPVLSRSTDVSRSNRLGRCQLIAAISGYLQLIKANYSYLKLITATYSYLQLLTATSS